MENKEISVQEEIQVISSYLANKAQLDDHAIHLLFSANRWEKRLLMEDMLRSGITLIAPEIGLLAPDLVVYDISSEKAGVRGGYGGERYGQLEFHKKVAKSYLTLHDSSWKVIQR
ncbi:hypothetical protein RDI58_013532 [Solanum bulbocastanum]|uniref:Uncharacterized protein n=1 Tax=Solanum bulbocastanum TaxID=147425 RepID=A0AAN8YER9_SOLBU